MFGKKFTCTSIAIGLGLGLFWFDQFKCDNPGKYPPASKVHSIQPSPNLQVSPKVDTVPQSSQNVEPHWTGKNGTQKPSCTCYGCDGVVLNTTCDCKTCHEAPIGIQALETEKDMMLYLHRVSLNNLEPHSSEQECNSIVTANTGACSCSVVFYSESNVSGTKGYQYFYDQSKKQGIIFHWTERKFTYQQCARAQEYSTRVFDSKLTLQHPSKIPKNATFEPFNLTLSSKKLIATDGNIHIFYDCEKRNPHLMVYTTKLVAKSAMENTTKAVEALLRTTSLPSDKFQWYIINRDSKCSYPNVTEFKELAKLKTK
ncbi:hypothetical protein M8J75_016109 [Diaphorina citri]|nr:hypothetical protein M8J75_016109 [Diaphorina citri]KAI5752976.1 hypothetical protein M8J77_022379 [Diaphorina citri]